MATKTIDSDLLIVGNVNSDIRICHPGDVTTGSLTLGYEEKYVQFSRMVFHNAPQGLSIYVHNSNDSNSTYDITPDGIKGGSMGQTQPTLGFRYYPWFAMYSKKFIVPDGTAAQFLKADGSLDSTTYATQTALTNLQNNAWKLSEANAESDTVVLSLQGNMSVFAALEKAGFNYESSRNIYVDLSGADSSIDDIFAGFEKVPVGIRYHIFFGNTKTDCKINWNSSKVESNIVPSLGLTPAYPTAKCEFMRVTEAWTYADWEAQIENVSHVVDTGTLDDTNNSILQGYLDKNGISYEKTAKGSLFNLANMLAALASSK